MGRYDLSSWPSASQVVPSAVLESTPSVPIAHRRPSKAQKSTGVTVVTAAATVAPSNFW
jgi:hypothetical protein